MTDTKKVEVNEHGQWEVDTRSEQRNYREKQSHERFRLQVRNVYNSETQKVDRCHLYAIVEYYYPSGRSKFSASGCDLTPTEARNLATHLNNMADAADNA